MQHARMRRVASVVCAGGAERCAPARRLRGAGSARACAHVIACSFRARHLRRARGRARATLAWVRSAHSRRAQARGARAARTRAQRRIVLRGDKDQAGARRRWRARAHARGFRGAVARVARYQPMHAVTCLPLVAAATGIRPARAREAPADMASARMHVQHARDARARARAR